MSAPIFLPDSETDRELDWVLLRDQLEQEREKDAFVPPYKRNIFVKLGLGATALSFAYILFNSHSTKKVMVGGSWRVGCQLFTLGAYTLGYYQFTKTPEYTEKKWW